MRAHVVLAVLVVAVSGTSAQSPPYPPQNQPPTKSTLRDSERAIVIEGCIRGNRLKISRATFTVSLLGATEFVLEGPKETLQRVKTEHDGHEDEISGVVVIPAADKEKEVVTTEIGKRTRVTAGASGTKSQETSTRAGFDPMRLKFSSLRHLSEKCSVPNS